MKLSSLSPKQLVEIDACSRCSECLKYCPAYAQKVRRVSILVERFRPSNPLSAATMGYGPEFSAPRK
jgi:ferredoxin